MTCSQVLSWTSLLSTDEQLLALTQLILTQLEIQNPDSLSHKAQGSISVSLKYT